MLRLRTCRSGRVHTRQSYIGAKWLQARRAAGLSHGPMARRLGKPRWFVGKYETGERRIDVVETFVILRTVGHDPLAFLDRALLEAPERLGRGATRR